MNLLEQGNEYRVVETDKTYETIPVTNHEFLSAVFRVLPPGVHPVVVGFRGKPEKGKWSGYAWTGKDGPQADENAYFSIAAFKADEAGKFARKKEQFSLLAAIMLDDIGTKIEFDRLTLKPSWLIETSQGNFQAGYILESPITDPGIADGLMNAIIDAELCDSGASGPCTRLARLPVGVNGKYDPEFRCELREWNPDLRYSVEDLVAGFQLGSIELKGKRNKAGKASSAPHGDAEEVYTPRPSENPVIAALKQKSLYGLPNGDGRHTITCPWVVEHTNQIDDGASYFEPSSTYPIGGFKCFHGHCSDRSVRDLLDFLQVSPAEARMKSVIRIVAGEVHRVVDYAERELANLGRYYQRAGIISTITTDPGTRETSTQIVSQPSLLNALAGAATWMRFDSRSGGWTRTDPQPKYVQVLHSLGVYRYLPVLLGLTRQPYLRQDWSLMREEGYDPDTKMFGVFNGKNYLIPDAPTREQAEAALQELNELLSEFSFKEDVDRSAALCAILTSTIRASLRLAPMFHVNAHMVGSGKSYLCELVTAFATPRPSTPATFPGDDEECRKFLLSEFMKNPAVVVFDNLTSDLLAHKSLCTALTSEFFTSRILGVSKTAEVSTRCLFLSSGNNVGPIQDMTRRCVTIRLAPQCEIPASREFRRPNLIAEVLGERERYVSAALIVIRGWLAAGAPKAKCRRLAGYDDWSDLCRQPLLWLGFQDPILTVFEAMNEDPDRELLGWLLETWRDVYGPTPAMIREALELGSYPSAAKLDLLEVAKEIALDRGEINRKKLGRWFKRNSGRIVNGLRLVRAGGHSSAERWKVEAAPVSSVLSVSNPPYEQTCISDEVPF